MICVHFGTGSRPFVCELESKRPKAKEGFWTASCWGENKREHWESLAEDLERIAMSQEGSGSE